MTAGNSLLQELLGEVPAREFFERFYLKLPFARAAEQPRWLPLANRAVLERLLQHPAVDAIVGRQGERWPGGMPNPQQIDDILTEGFTIGLRHVDRYDDDLKSLADQFHEIFAAPIDVHLYATPANHVGFGWHYDAEEVFVLQCTGSKDWWLRKNTVNPWPLIDFLPADQHYEREIMPAMRCRLNPGDWLYIPGGYWHRTQVEAESISLSVGVRAWTALDIFDALRPVLADSLRWRQRLPRLDEAEQLESLIAELADELAREFRDEGFRHRWIEQFQARDR